MMPMRVAVCHGDRRISIETAPRPVAAAREALVRVKRTALCGSDGKRRMKGAAVTAGHEMFGVVEHAGHPLDGRRCLVYIPVHGSVCASCTRFAANVELLGANRARYRRFADAEFPLADLPREFARFMAGERVKPQTVC